MRKKLQRWGSFLTIMALASFLWGCGNSVMGVDDHSDNRTGLVQAGTDTPTGGDDGGGQWW